MVPIDLARLRWDEYLTNAAVDSAYRDLCGLTTRAITLHASVGALSFWTAWRDGILVFANVSSPTVHQEIVHELVHAILMEEAYWRPGWGDDTQTRGALSNELQHPEVFRRMEEYGLDMAPYWAGWELKLLDGLARLKNRDIDQLHYHFLQVFTWLFFPVASKRCLDEYRRFNPAVYDAARRAQHDARQVGTSNAAHHRRFLAVFMRHWIEFCTSNLPRDDQGRHVLRLLAESRLECVREKVNKRSGQFINDYLRKNHLV